MMMFIQGSARAHADLAHLEVGQGPQVGEEDAHQHEPVPDLVAMAARVVLPRVVPLGAPQDVDVQSAQVAGPQDDVVREGTHEVEGVAVVAVEEVVDHHVHQRDDQRHPEPPEQQRLVLLVARFVNPLEQANHEEGDGREDDGPQVESGHLELAVHAVVDRREGATRDEEVDAGVVKAVCEGVDLTAGHGVEEVEDGAAEQAGHGRYQEEHDGPPADLLGPLPPFVELNQLEGLRVDGGLQLFEVVLQLVEPGAVQLVVYSADHQGGQRQLELPLGPLELRSVLANGVLETRAQDGVVVRHCLLQRRDVLPPLLRELVVLHDEGQVLQSSHVVLGPVLQSTLVVLQRLAHGFPVDCEVEENDGSQDEDRGQAVAPDVHALVVEHEQAAEDFLRGVEVDAVAMSDVPVVLHEVGRRLVVPNHRQSLLPLGPLTALALGRPLHQFPFNLIETFFRHYHQLISPWPTITPTLDGAYTRPNKPKAGEKQVLSENKINL